MSEILSTYNLNFIIYTIFGKKRKGCKAEQGNIQASLGLFLGELQNEAELNELIIEVNKIINGEEQLLDEAPNDSVIAFIEQTNTKFCELIGEPVDYNKPVFTMPTIDFRDILIEWNSFLLKPL